MILSSEKKYSVEIYTDGSCLKNPGEGAFAFMIIDHVKKNLHIMSKFYESTTNNQMEMLSCVFALKHLLKNNKIYNSDDNNSVLILTDSQYLKNGINDWIFKWKKNNWRTSTNEAVKNQSIWIEIDNLNQKIKPDWKHVKAHADNPNNNFVDKIANFTARNKRNLTKSEIYQIFDDFFCKSSYDLIQNFPHSSFEKNLIFDF